MNKTVFAVVLLSALSIPVSAHDKTVSQLGEKFKTLYPNTPFKEIRQAPITGLYEVLLGDDLAYTDETGRYFIFGHLFDMQQQVDLTEQRKQEVHKVEFPTASLRNAIKTVRGNGSRVVAVFSDPDCSYCQKLEGELARLENITLYTFLYPLESLHPEAKAKAIGVWCSSDPDKAWRALMQHGQLPKPATCDHPVDENLKLGSRLGIRGTPTLIAVDGRLLPGSVSAEKIDQWLNAVKPSVQQGASE